MKILNIGIDADLFKDDSEVLKRQLIYSKKLPADFVHLVKTDKSVKLKSRQITKSFKIIPIRVSHWLFFITIAIYKSFKILKREKFDLIQTQDPFLTGIIGFTVSKLFRIPLVIGIYSDEIDNPLWIKESYLNKFANIVGKYILKRSAASRTDSKDLKEKLLRYNFPNLTYIPFMITNSVNFLEPDDKFKKIKKELLSNKKGPIILSVSRLEPEKNLFFMLDIFSNVLKIYPDAILTIIGNGSLYKRLVSYSKKKCPGSVRWIGHVDNSSIHHYYQASDIFLITSLRESAARVIYESTLSGTPVVSSDTAGSKELIDNETNGYIIPINNLKLFTEKLIFLIRNKKVLKNMATKAQLKSKKLVSEKNIINELRKFYSVAINHSK